MTIKQYGYILFLRLAVLVLVGVVAATPAWAQTNPQVRLVLRAVSNDDIAAYKLPPTTQKSGGLTTIGLGQPAYLEVLVSAAVPASDIGGATWQIAKQPSDSTAVLEQSPFGMDVPSYEPSDRASSRVVARMMLRPDVEGPYTVTAKVSIAGVGTVEVSKRITAATYMGISACAGCHDIGTAGTIWSMVKPWSKTGHAKIFKEGLDGVASDHYGPNCVSCHTVGYDKNPKAVNGGFDDVVTLLSWVFPAVLQHGTFDAQPAALKIVGNIQCENCHGPGSRLIANGGATYAISVSPDSGACGQCHGALSHHYRSAEWANSRHAIATSYPTGAGREGCVGCHTGIGFIATNKQSETVPTGYSAISCQVCHESHGRTTPDGAAHQLRTLASVTLADGTELKEAGRGLLCMNCHRSRREAAVYAATSPASAHFGPHYGTQADMLAGTNGYTYGEEIPSSAHSEIVEDTCVACHMQTVTSGRAFTKAGGHTFQPAYEGSGSDPGVELTALCQTCHGKNMKQFDRAMFDHDGDGKIEGLQTEVQHLLDQLSALLPPVGKPKSDLTIDSNWTRPQLKGAYNWEFVKEDGSYGIHNTSYAVGLLKASIKDLKSQ